MSATNTQQNATAASSSVAASNHGRRSNRRTWLFTAAALLSPLLVGCGNVDGEFADEADSNEAALTASTMWVGGAVTEPNSTVENWLAVSRPLGPWRIRRSFNTHLPNHINKTSAADDVANNVISFASVKPPSNGSIEYDIKGVADGKYDSDIRALAASFPKDHTTYLTMFHEPENDMSGAQFVPMFKRFYKVVKAANPKIQVGTVHMSYQWRPSTDPNLPTKNPDSWWVGAENTDFIGVDDYNNAIDDSDSKDDEVRSSAKTDKSFQRWYGWAKTKGKPLAVVEFGRFENKAKPATIVKDVQDTEKYLREQGFFMFLYWQGLSKKNSKGEIWDYRLSSTQAKDAMKAIAAQGKKGW